MIAFLDIILIVSVVIAIISNNKHGNDVVVEKWDKKLKEDKEKMRQAQNQINHSRYGK